MPTQQNQPKKRLPRLPRFRALMKWSGLTLCVLIFALWLASGWYEFDYALTFGQQPARFVSIRVMASSAVIVHLSPPPPDPPSAHLSHGSPLQFPLSSRTSAITIWRNDATFQWWWRWSFWSEALPNGGIFRIPLFVPLLITATISGFLFYRDRKVRPGLCAVCRYNLRGLPPTTSKCPECGREIKSQKTARG